MATIYNTNSNTLLSGTSDRDTIKNGGYWYEDGTWKYHDSGTNVTIDSGAGNDDIYNDEGSNVKINGGAGNDTIYNEGTHALISSGAGNDSIYSYGWYIDNVSSTIFGGAGNDTIEIYYVDNTKISGGAGNDFFIIRGEYVTADGGGGDDEIEIYDVYATISGGAGNDTIKNWGYRTTVSSGIGNDVIYNNWNFETNSQHVDNGNTGLEATFKYENGGGDDIIYGFRSDSTLSIGRANYSTTKSGSDLIVTVDKGSILLKDVSKAKIVTVSSGGYDDDGGDDSDKNSWKLSGTTATYGTSKKTLVTVKGVKSLDGISLKNKVVTVANSSLNNSKVTISDGYTLKLASGVSKPSTKKAAWSYANSTATYKSSYKTAGYTLASDKKSISYTKATSATTLAKITGAKSTSGRGTPSGKKITLKNSALKNKVTVSGSYEFDFAASCKNATISGTAKADTITARGSNLKIFGGKGNDSLKMVGTNQTISGGDGADIFIYAASGGKEKITDFSSNDKLKIGASGTGTYSTVASGKNFVVSTDDGGKITLVGAAGKSLDIIGTESVSGGSGRGVKVSSNGKKITLTENFEDSSFSLTGKYSSAITLNASATLLDLNLTGNKFSNRIIGSS